MSSRRRLLAAVVLLAFALRVAGVGFGLPLAESRPDEITIAYQAMKFGTGDLNPHSFNYPTLFKYLMFALFGAWYVVGKVIGHFEGRDEFLLAFFNNEASFRLLMRLFSVGMGTLGVALLARLPGGVASAFFLAVSFLHVRDSHFGVTDITMVTACIATAVACDRLVRAPSRRAAIVAGVCAGLATSVKYNAAVLGLPLLLAGGGVVGVVAMGAAFVAGSPFVLFDARTFVRDFLYETRHLSEGQHVDVGLGWLHHLGVSLPIAVGWPVLLAGIAGAFWWTREERRRGMVLFSFPLVYFLLIGKGETAFFRYILPVLPFLCVGAGVLVSHFAPRAVLVLALPSLIAALQADRLFLAGDTREAMGAWIEANVPSDATIVHAGAYTGAPMVQRNVANQTREYEAKRGRSDSAGFRKPDDLKWYDRSRPMYDVLFVRKAGIDFASQVDVPEARQVEWLEIEESPLVHYSAVPSELLTGDYELVHEEIGHTGEGLFDQQDAFYMPARNFRGWTRMGPNLRLYRRTGLSPPRAQ